MLITFEAPYQIRLHLQYLQAPIVGDVAYGGEDFYLSSLKKKFNLKAGETEQPFIKRFALHALQLQFAGLDSEEITVKAPYPKDFRVLVDVLAQNRIKSAAMRDALAPLARHERVAHLRQCGTIFAFDAIEPDASRAATFSRRFFATALEHELMLRPIGRTVYLMPPYILAPDQIADLAARTRAVFDATLA